MGEHSEWYEIVAKLRAELADAQRPQRDCGKHTMSESAEILCGVCQVQAQRKEVLKRDADLAKWKAVAAELSAALAEARTPEPRRDYNWNERADAALLAYRELTNPK